MPFDIIILGRIDPLQLAFVIICYTKKNCSFQNSSIIILDDISLISTHIKFNCPGSNLSSHTIFFFIGWNIYYSKFQTFCYVPINLLSIFFICTKKKSINLLKNLSFITFNGFQIKNRWHFKFFSRLNYKKKSFDNLQVT